jgi:hypothetical protein
MGGADTEFTASCVAMRSWYLVMSKLLATRSPPISSQRTY